MRPCNASAPGTRLGGGGVARRRVARAGRGRLDGPSDRRADNPAPPHVSRSSYGLHDVRDGSAAAFAVTREGRPCDLLAEKGRTWDHGGERRFPMRGDRERRIAGGDAEAFIPEDHPLRRIKPLVDGLARLSPRFDAMYAQRGRSIPPEHLLKGSLLIALYSVRSERQFCGNCAALQVGPERRRRALQRHDLLQEPGAAAGGRRGARLLRRDEARRRRLMSAELQRGRDAAGGVGVPRATARGTNRSRRRGRVGATPRWTSGASAGAGRRTPPARTRRRSCIARGPSKRRCSVIWAMR